MLVDEMPRSFIKKNNSYSHCPLKKRPVHVLLAEDVPVVTKEEVIDIVVDDIPEPENLSTKPEDLSKTAEKLRSQFSRSPSPIVEQSSVFGKRPASPVRSRSPSPYSSRLVSHLHHQQQHHQYVHYPSKTITPPVGIAPIHPVAKKARVEVIQHDHVSPTAAVAAPMHFMATKTPLEPLNLNTPMEPLAHYPAQSWARSTPLYPSHYLHYPTYRYHHHPGAELYQSYPVPAAVAAAAYPHSSPEHSSVSPPPHAALTCPTIQRPIARSYAHWASPDHCGLSPTSSLGSSSLRSPPPVTPEDLSSPGSDSGRSSAGSTSAGPTMINQKLDKSSANNTSPTSPRYSCPDCGKSYSTYSGLSKHQQFHCASAEGQTKKSFSCKYCEKVYVSLGALKMHIRTHTLPCKCHLCGKAFSRPWLLQGHIRTHTGEKPFICQHCKRAFADRSNLRAHLQTHSDVKKYSCPSCSKTFSRMSLLTKHQEGGCPGVAVSMGFSC